MRYNRIFSSKTVLFALLFSIFSFNSVLFAAQCDPFEEPVGGCHVCGGCGLSANDLYNATPFQEPSYSPSWTTVTSNGRVSAKQYLKFAVVEGNIYKWSTFNGEYGGEDYIADAVYSKQCLNDSDCNSDNLKCIGAIGNVYGFCNYPFDTELTLLKGDACSADAELIAFSNSEDDRNQTSLEWKATFTGNVVLLVTNFEFKFNSDNNGGYYHCSTNSNGFDTTVKWQRTSSEPCTTCGDVAKYRVDKSSVTPAEAPEWTPIQANEYALPGTVISSSSEHNWLFKPGSYVVFDVKESEIYRWSTCVSEFYDTQLSLFKGEGTAGNCGDFLAYGDDSRVSYKSGDVEYCPRGTKQTLLEWQANFTGKVTLLINEYNCYQCSSNNNDWSDCFTVTDNFKAEPGEGGVMTPVYDANGLPIKASPSDQSVTMTYLFSFPLDWQRYDCTKNCTSGSASAKVYDFCGNSGCSGSGWQSFGSGGSQTLSSG